MKQTPLEGQRGFSLAEVLIAMAISLVVLGLVGGLFLKQLSTYNTQEQVVRMHQNGQLAMKVMVREIRNAGYNHQLSATAFCPFTSVTGPNAVTIKQFNPAYTKTTYDLSGTTLRRTVNGNVVQRFGNIQSLDFIYRDATGAVTTPTTFGLIRQVEVTLTARTERPDKDYPLNGGYRALVLKSTITPRNFSN